MKMKRTIELSFESSSLSMRRTNHKSTDVWCALCGGSTPMVTPEEAGVRLGLGVRAVFKLIEDGRIHFLERPEGALLVCLWFVRLSDFCPFG